MDCCPARRRAGQVVHGLVAPALLGKRGTLGRPGPRQNGFELQGLSGHLDRLIVVPGEIRNMLPNALVRTESGSSDGAANLAAASSRWDWVVKYAA